MNQLETKLQAIQTTKTELKKQYWNTDDEHQRRKIEHKIFLLDEEETETLAQLNVRLDDIILTEPYDKPETDG